MRGKDKRQARQEKSTTAKKVKETKKTDEINDEVMVDVEETKAAEKRRKQAMYSAMKVYFKVHMAPPPNELNLLHWHRDYILLGDHSGLSDGSKITLDTLNTILSSMEEEKDTPNTNNRKPSPKEKKTARRSIFKEVTSTEEGMNITFLTLNFEIGKDAINGMQ